MVKLVCGVGINDADYPVSPLVNGKRQTCKYYRTWQNMLKRCYFKSHLISNPTYVGCSVDPSWLYFMTFRSWMMNQDWVGKHLDKDLLVKDNKVYGPDFCSFIRQETNKFLTDRVLHRGDYLIGVSFYKRYGNFRAQVSDGNGKVRHIGYFASEKLANNAWFKAKFEVAKEVASKEVDNRVKLAILDRYNLNQTEKDDVQ